MAAQPLRAFKARFEPELYEELQTVSELSRSSINHIVNAAVRLHLQQSRAALIAEYQEALARLQEYSRRDPDFEQAILGLVDAEAKAEEDPAEGRVVDASGSKRSESKHRLEDIFDGNV